ncbi:hypothetical protein L596_029520 [Steinernema carpocapsae]|uniref:Uncharacterized protein n=1 Tax=Steinernema carpocapsae TaxID=34508 RepID=A0A4U5LUW6_STECR|nr:hypothetical protein L596_029520 [Steinernema carpocapsae]
MKHAFYKAVGRRILSREELETLLVEIEGVLNSRPLTYQGTDMEEEMVIRPIDFIQRGILLDLELGMTKEDDEEYLPPFERNSIRTKIQAIASIKSTWDIAESFWTTWSTVSAEPKGHLCAETRKNDESSTSHRRNRIYC